MSEANYLHHFKRNQHTRRVISRFLEKILLSEIRFHNGTPCWEWQAALDTSGYSRFSAWGQHYGHRVSYLYFCGEIPPGLEVDHACNNRKCVSPLHLCLLTRQKNMGRIRRSECLNGHELKPENVYMYKDSQNCKKCRYERIKKWRRSKSI